ncbi:hypothetical protein EGM51_09590 [Verrucomicrobia bacterium S94]|nr:hypothetical protein EGM51_09590 [Verrucomicrobia bacterium S94]
MKKIIATAAMAACAAVVTAQTVTSANIVGYTKVETVPGLVIASQQFEGSDATPTGLFGDSLPLGSKIYKYDPVSGYIGNIAEYQTIFLSGDAWSAELDLSEGSFWVETTVASTNIFSGEVPSADSITNSLPPGLSLQRYPWPVEVSINDLDLTPALGDKIYKYDPETGYIGNIAEYQTIFLSGDAWSADLVFAVGEGFWYENNAGTTNVWVEAKPF